MTLVTKSFVQNGLQTFSFKVEIRGNVAADDGVVRIVSGEVLDLTLQIFFLMCAADSSIKDAPLRRLFVDDIRGSDTFEVMETFSSLSISQTLDDVFVTPTYCFQL